MQSEGICKVIEDEKKHSGKRIETAASHKAKINPIEFYSRRDYAQQ